MILFIRIVGVKTFPIRGGLHQDITGPFYTTGLAQNSGLQKKYLEEGELRKEEQDEQSPYSKQKWGKEPTPEWTLFTCTQFWRIDAVH
jgi:hypothetical protein